MKHVTLIEDALQLLSFSAAVDAVFSEIDPADFFH